jgi:hypothetical protein
MGQLSKMAKAVQSAGRGKDTVLAHIMPEEARLLKQLGGRGSRNPRTGLLEFEDAGENDTGTDAGVSEASGGSTGGSGSDSSPPGFGPSISVGYAPGMGPGTIGGTPDWGESPGSTPTESFAERTGLSPTTLADMINVGMSPDRFMDRSLAKIGTWMGLPPDNRKASQKSIMNALTLGRIGPMFDALEGYNTGGLKGALSNIGVGLVDALAGRTGIGSLANTALGFTDYGSLGKMAMDKLGVTPESPTSPTSPMSSPTSFASLSTPGQQPASDITSLDYGGEASYQPQLTQSIRPVSPQATQAVGQLAKLAPITSSVRMGSYNPYTGNHETYGQDPRGHQFFS